MVRATSAETTPRSISQRKKVSPASPDHSVPSQSNAATRGRSRRTDSRKACPAGWMVCASIVFIHFDDNVRTAKSAMYQQSRAVTVECASRFVIPKRMFLREESASRTLEELESVISG